VPQKEPRRELKNRGCQKAFFNFDVKEHFVLIKCSLPSAVDFEE